MSLATDAPLAQVHGPVQTGGGYPVPLIPGRRPGRCQGPGQGVLPGAAPP
jgi:hypothetical protein